MTVQGLAPPRLQCPRCAGVMFREAADALDYLCLWCGEYRVLGRAPAIWEPMLQAEAIAPRRRGRPRRSQY